MPTITINDMPYDDINRELETLRRNAEALSNSLRAGLIPDVKPAMQELDRLNDKIKSLEKSKAKVDRQYSQPVVVDYDDIITQLDNLDNKAQGLRAVLRQGLSLDVTKDLAELHKVETQIKTLETLKKDFTKNDFTPANPQNYQELLSYIDLYKEKISDLQIFLKSGETGEDFFRDMQKLEAYTKDLKRLEGLRSSFGIVDVQSIEEANQQLAQLYDRANDIRSNMRSGSSQDFSQDLAELAEIETQVKAIESIKQKMSKDQFLPANPQSYQELITYIDVYKEKIRELQEYLASGETGDQFTRDQSALAAYTNDLKRLEGMRISLGFTDIQSIDDINTKLESLREKANVIRGILREGISFNFQSDTSELKDIEQEIRQLESLKNEVSRSDFTPANPQNFQELNEKIDEYKEKIRQLQIYLKSGETGEDFFRDNQKLEEYVKDLSRLEKMKDAFGIVDVQSLKDANQQLEALQRKANEIRKNMRNGSSQDVSQDMNELRDIEKQIKAIQSVKSAMTNEDFAPVHGVLGLLKETLATKMKIGKTKMQLLGTSDMEGAQQRIKMLNGRMKELGEIWKSLKSSVLGQVFGSIATGVKGAIAGIKALASAITNLATGAFNLLKTAVTTTINNMKRLVTGGFNMVKSGINTFKSGLQSVSKHIHALVKKGTPSLMKSLTSLKSMLMRRIKRTFISAIFNQAKEGLQSLAKHSESFNQAMSNIKNTAQQTAGNLAVTLGNLVETIAPALQTLLGWFNKVLEAINALFAMLTGKKTVTVAKKGTDDYAKSLKKASGSAKELNNQLYGFDEITRQEGNNGGSGSGDSGIEYEEMAVDSVLGNLKSAFEEIINAFKAGEFEKVGQLVAEQLNNVIYAIDDFVVSIREKAVTWSSNIARILNGLVDGWDANATGKLLADGINLVLDVINTFISTFDFNTLGKKLGDGIKGIFDNIEWDLVGETIANWFNMLPRFLSGLFEKIPWSDIGKNLATGVMSMFNNIDWEARKQAFVRGINGITDTLYNFITNVDLGDIASKFFNNVNGIVNGINWNRLKDTVVAGVDKIKDALSEMIKSGFFTNIASRMGKLVGGILNDIDFEGLAKLVSIGLSKLRFAFWEFINRIDFPNLAKKLGNAINGMFTDSNVKKSWEESRKQAVEGINKIIKAFGILVNGDENGEGAIDFVGMARTIGDDLSRMITQINFSDAVRNIGTLIGKLATAFFELVGEVFTPKEGKGLGEQLADGLNGLFKNDKGEVDTSLFSGLGESIHKAIIALISTVADFVETVDIDAIVQGIVALLEKIEFGDIAKKLVTLVGDGLTKLVDAIPNLLTGILQVINSIPWLDVATAILENLGKVALSAIKAVGGVIGTLWDWLWGQGAFENAPEIVNAQTVQEWQDQMGDAGQKSAQAYLDELHRIVEEDDSWSQQDYDNESNRKAILAAAGAMGIGYQDAFAKAVEEGWLTSSEYAYLSQATDEMLETIKNSSSIQGVKDVFATYGMQITDSLADHLRGKGKEDIAASIALLGAGMEEEAIASMNIDGLSSHIRSYMSETGLSIQEIALYLTGKTKDEIAEMTGQTAEEVGKKLGGITPEAMRKSLEEGIVYVEDANGRLIEAAKATPSDATEAKESSEAVGKGATEGAEEKIKEGTDSVKTASSDMMGAIKTVFNEENQPIQDEISAMNKGIDEKISELPEDEQEHARQMMDLILSAIEEGDPTVVSAIETCANSVVSKVQEILASSKGYDIAKGFMDGMTSAIVSHESGSYSLTSRVGQYAMDVLYKANSILTFSNGETIGENIIKGMYQGVTNWGQNLVDKVAEACQAVIDTANTAFEINSPSRVFRQIGEYTMEGMQIGLESAGKDAVGTVGDITSQMADLGNGTTFDSMTNGLGEVATEFERIVNVFSALADTIADMGGLEIPTIASGKTIPYATQIESGKPVQSTMDESAVENAFYNALRRATTVSDSEQQVNITLQIDGRKMADIVSKYQRQQNRAWGV